MTVGTKVKQTIASLKSAQANLESFALETQNKAAKRLYEECAQQAKAIVEQMESRLKQIQEEEPQYKDS
ncbi:MAG: DUF1657 domain-containing protein [Clostridia bacterium]|nr:DUF1657 domain-containing protein [Clostridia bacterium]